MASDATIPACVAVDNEAAKRARVLAEEADKHERDSWDRRCRDLSRRAKRAEYGFTEEDPHAAVPTPAPFVAKPIRTDRESGFETALHPSGRVFEMGDAEEGAGLWEREAETVGVTDLDVENAKTRDSTFVWVCKNRAGEVIDAETKAKADRAQAELRENSMNLALALASAGVPAFLPAKAPRASIVCPETEQRIDIAPLRRINFLPTQAKQRRDPVVKQLEAYAKTRRCRMAMFTAGTRLPVNGVGEAVRARVEWLHRRLSALNASELFKSHGVQMQLRATEFGSVTLACPWPRRPGTEAGLPYVHIHSHVVYTLEKQLSPRRWKRFLAKVHNKWRFHWGDNGELRNVREACKYPIKPGDYSHLTNDMVASFYHATRGLHLVQPLGDFREVLRERRDATLKLVRLRNSKADLELRAKPDWNARIGRLTTREKNNRAAYREQEKRRALSLHIKTARLLEGAHALRLAAALLARNLSPVGVESRKRAAYALMLEANRVAALAEFLFRCPVRPFEEKRRTGVAKLKVEDKANNRAKPMLNRVASRLAPAPYFDRVLRPALLVWNFDGNYAGLREHGFVREYLDAVRAQIRRGEQNLNVHTSHTTVGSDPGSIPLLERAEAWAGPPMTAEPARN